MPAHSVDTDTVTHTPVDLLSLLTLVNVILTVRASEATWTLTRVRSNTRASVITGGLTLSCNVSVRLCYGDMLILTLALMSITHISINTPTRVAARTRAEARGIAVARVTGLGTWVHRQTRGVGGVHPVAGLTVTMISTGAVDTLAMLQAAVVTMVTSRHTTLVNILAVSPIALRTEISNSD